MVLPDSDILRRFTRPVASQNRDRAADRSFLSSTLITPGQEGDPFYLDTGLSTRAEDSGGVWGWEIIGVIMTVQTHPEYQE